MKKPWFITSALLTAGSLAYAAPPLSLSAPAIDGVLHVGDTPTSYTYTIHNITGQTIPVWQSVSGNSTDVDITTPCTSVPPHGSCSFIVTIEPTVAGYILGTVSDVVRVNYNGRLPANLSSPLSTTIDLPGLLSLSVTPEPATTLANGHMTYTATAVSVSGKSLDITPVVTWSSSDTTVASAPNAQGQATTYVPGGSSVISATFPGLSSNSSSLTVNNSVYVASYLTGAYICSMTGTNPTGCITESASTIAAPIIDIALNPQATFIYLANNTATVNVCSVDATTTNPAGQYTNCTPYTDVINDDIIDKVQLSPNGQFIYAHGSRHSRLYKCTISLGTGGIGQCEAQTTNNPSIDSFTVDPNGLYMYLFGNPNTSPYVQSCQITPSTGTLSSCENQLAPGVNNSDTRTPFLTAVNTTGGTYLYGTTYSSTGVHPHADGGIMVCSINSTAGTVGSCSYPALPSGTVMYQPYGISVTSTSSGALELYEADNQNGGIHNCVIGSDYVTLTSCHLTNDNANNGGIVAR